MKMNRLLAYILLTLAGIGLAACDTYEQDEFNPEVVVESYLVADEPLPEIRVSMTAPIMSHYTFEAYAIENADVVVNLLDENGGVEKSYPFVPSSKGIYRAENADVVVQPLRRYALEVRVLNQAEVVRSETIVPGRFDILELSTDTVVYQAGEQLEARLSNSIYPGRKSLYMFTIEAKDTVNYDLTPFYADLVEDVDDMSRSDLARNASGFMSEDGYYTTPGGDGSITIRLPWIAVAFYGPNEIVVNAMDDNLYDFKRSQIGGVTTSPGEMDNLLDHVENGRGVFGSIARARQTMYVAVP